MKNKTSKALTFGRNPDKGHCHKEHVGIYGGVRTFGECVVGDEMIESVCKL